MRTREYNPLLAGVPYTLRYMAQNGPRRDENTHDFLPPVQTTKMVPMTAEIYQRQRMKKIAIWVGAAVLGLVIVGSIVWRSSAPASARNDFDDGIRLYNAGKYREAIQVLDTAIDRKVNLADAYQLRGTIYRILNDPKRAADDLSKVIELRPDLPDNYRIRGQAYRDLGVLPRALEDFNKLVQLQPSAAAYNLRGIAFRDSGNMVKALEDFSRSIALDPTVDNYLQRGMAYESLGDHKHAIEDFDKVVEMRPEVPYTYRARAFAREAAGDRSGALADRETARSIEYPPKGTPPEKAQAKKK